jgi:hypothetical protein
VTGGVEPFAFTGNALTLKTCLKKALHGTPKEGGYFMSSLGSRVAIGGKKEFAGLVRRPNPL